MTGLGLDSLTLKDEDSFHTKSSLSMIPWCFGLNININYITMSVKNIIM